MIASVSHELRTPLTAILGFAEVLREHPPIPPEERVMISTIADQASEMSHIVEDLLVAARTDAEQIALSPEPLIPLDAVRSVIRALRMEEWIEVSVHNESRVMADAVRLRQILRNLVTNAERYGGEAVRLDIAADASLVTFTVADDGEGIPQGMADAVFEPYVSGGVAAGRPGSLGLGLTVSRRLARMMGGELVHRRTDGWTVFELSLPAATVTPTPRIQTPHPSQTEPA